MNINKWKQAKKNRWKRNWSLYRPQMEGYFKKMFVEKEEITERKTLLNQ